MKKTDKPRMDDVEWEAQERGMRAASGTDAEGLPPMAARYRAVAEALASMPRSEPPADFAAGVVRRLARRDAGLERALSRILLAVFVVVAAILGLGYGEQFWQLLRQALGSAALGWVLASLGCLSLSWMGHRVIGYSSPAGVTGAGGAS